LRIGPQGVTIAVSPAIREDAMKKYESIHGRYPWLAGGLLAVAAVAGCLAEESGTRNKTEIDVRCPVELGLTPESGVVEDWVGAARAWEARVEDGRLTLTRRYSCGDECAFTEEIVLSGLAEECPAFVSASLKRSDAGGALGPAAKTTAASKGTLEIESWDPESGIVSGRLTSEVKFVFYVSRAPAP
jgi:hypothetical protein